MSNGPMGGFMPTPPAPSQPPAVKLDTTATSRGNFNEFLRNMNGAMNPPLAPMVGAAAPTLAPTMSDIDIFNPPVQNFEIGGFAGDTSGTFSVDDDTGQTSDSFDFFSGSDEPSSVLTGDDDQAISDLIAAGTNVVPQNIFADDAQASVGTNVGLEKSGGFSAGVQKDVPGRFTAFRSPSFAMRGLARDFRSKIRDAGDNGLTVSNYFNTFNPSDDNKDRLEEFKSLTGKSGSDKLNLNDMNNIMNIQAKYEAGIRNVAPSVQKAILSTVDIDDDRKVEDILGDLDLGINLAGNRDDIRSIEANPVFSPAMAGLPLVKSTRSTVPEDQARAIINLVGSGSPKAPTISEQLQENVRQQQLAERGRALGPIQFGDDLANFSANVRGQQPTVDTVFDIDTRDTRNFVGDDFEPALNLADRNEADRLAAGQAMGVGTAPNLQNLTSTAMGRGIKPDESMTMVEAGGKGIPAPKEFRDPFPNAGIKIGSRTIPTIFSLANEFSKYSRGRVLDSIAQKGYTPVYDGDVIVGAKDKFGNLMEGMDPNAPMGSNENEDPIIRPIIPIKKKEEEVKDKPPNIIGGMPIASAPALPTVVDSPFAPATSKIEPSKF
jgi:hypothetical protein